MVFFQHFFIVVILAWYLFLCRKKWLASQLINIFAEGKQLCNIQFSVRDQIAIYYHRLSMPDRYVNIPKKMKSH